MKQNAQSITLLSAYVSRQAALATWMAKNGIGAVVFEDCEERRDPSVRYFTGHPSDAICIITVTGECALCPWDINIAEKNAYADLIIPYETFDRSPISAVSGLLAALKVPNNTKIEISPTIPYPVFLQYVDALTGFDIRCRENGTHQHTADMREIKDSLELESIRKACEITNTLIEKIEESLKNGSLKTETDVALLIERECREAGCERTGFETLAAGPDRSFAIHCFPSYTAGNFIDNGLSILDFGVVYGGYTSDVTLTIAKGELSKGQEKLITLVEKAYKNALACYMPNQSIKDASLKATEVFTKGKKSMPHALGHGIGLEAHEAPFIRNRTAQEDVFLPGMVVTLEPGLYDAKLGGCRLENDILITAEGNEVLTKSHIIRL